MGGNILMLQTFSSKCYFTVAYSKFEIIGCDVIDTGHRTYKERLQHTRKSLQPVF